MIYKAFLNRQEITGFPVKGKETSEIWGGNTLLWKKEKARKPFTVIAYHTDENPVTNGNQIFARFMFSNKRNYGWAFVNYESPYINTKIEEGGGVAGEYTRTIQACAECNGSICAIETRAYFTTYANNIYSLHITIHSFKNSKEASSTCVINADEGTSFDEPKSVWQSDGYIYYYIKNRTRTGKTRVREMVFKIAVNGTLVGKYEKWKEKADDKDAIVIAPYLNLSEISSGSNKYLVNKEGHFIIYELKQNPFDIVNIIDTSVIPLSEYKYYIGFTNNKHIFMSFPKRGSKIGKIYEFIEGEFIEKRTTNLIEWFDRVCVYKNHIYAVNDENVLDCGDIETGSDDKAKIVGKIPYSENIELIFAQNGYIYIIHYSGKETIGSEASTKHYMTVIPL